MYIHEFNLKLYKLLFIVVCCFTLLVGCSNSNNKPNILFISIDDMNDWVGVLGGHTGMDIHTPNIDKLAGSSFLFTNAHTPSPACAPARTAIMTGVHPARSGLMQNFGGDGPVWRDNDILQDVETLEQFFKNRGYKTLAGGKIYHTLEPQRTPRSQIELESWDYYYPSAQINLPYQIRIPEEIREAEYFREWPRGQPEWHTYGPIPIEDDKMSDYHIVEWASHELRQKQEQPFFLAAGIFRPHSPWEVPQKYFDLYPIEEVVLPEHLTDDLKDAADHGRRETHKWALQNEQWRNIVQAYAASVTFADAMVGKLLDALEKSDHSDNTIVVLWSDHGMHLGEKENYEKFTLWERSTRVPFIIKIPGLTKAGSQSNQPVSLIDIYPTLAEAAGFELPDHLDGISLIPQFKDTTARHSPIITSFRMGGGTGVGHAVRSKNYRYIFYPEIGLEELYDHRTDPNEWENNAYKQENYDIIQHHRQVLLDLLPNIRWAEGNTDPFGFEIMNDGSIQKENFVPMLELLEGL